MDADWIVLETAAEADEHVSDQDIEETLGWFEDKQGVPTEEFIDRLCSNGATYDLENYLNPAAKRILSRARKMKRERDN